MSHPGADGVGQAQGPPRRLLIGGRDVTHLCDNFVLRRKVNAPNELTFSIDAVGARDNLIDWQAQVSFEIGHGPRVQTYGFVVTKAFLLTPTMDAPASTQVPVYHVTCRDPGTILDEVLVPPFKVINMTSLEVVDHTLSVVGWPDDLVTIEGLDDLPLETFVVLAPVIGVTVSAPHRVGSVVLLPEHDISVPAFTGANLSRAGTWIESANCWAKIEVKSRRVSDAKVRGLLAADLALAWLTSRARDSSTVRPDHQVSFDRQRTLVVPSRGTGVIVRGQTTGRQIVAATNRQPSGESMDLGRSMIGPGRCSRKMPQERTS